MTLYDSDFLFSQGDKRSYDSDSDSDSDASENQPLVAWGVISQGEKAAETQATAVQT